MTHRYVKALTSLLGASALIAGCAAGGQNSASAPDGGLPDELTIPYIATLEGATGPFAERMRNGAKLAIEQANESGKLGTTLNLNFIPIGPDPQQGVRATTEAVQDNPPAILYGTGSTVATAIAPIAQRSKIPLVLNQSGAEGVVETGKYIYRTTAPQVTYQGPHAEFIASEGVERIAIIYGRDIATLDSLANDVWPTLVRKHGMKIVKSVPVGTDDTQLGAVVSQMMQSNPDAVLMFLIGQQNSTVVGELTRRGFEGRIGAQTGIAAKYSRALVSKRAASPSPQISPWPRQPSLHESSSRPTPRNTTRSRTHSRPPVMTRRNISSRRSSASTRRRPRLCSRRCSRLPRRACPRRRSVSCGSSNAMPAPRVRLSSGEMVRRRSPNGNGAVARAFPRAAVRQFSPPSRRPASVERWRASR